MARLDTATRHTVIILHQQGVFQAKIWKQTGDSECAVLLKKHKETDTVKNRRRNAPYKRHIKLTSHQQRAGGNQWDPGTVIYCPKKSGQKCSSWKNCSQKQIPPIQKQGTQLGCRTNASRGCGLMSQNVKYLAVPERLLLVERLTVQ